MQDQVLKLEFLSLNSAGFSFFKWGFGLMPGTRHVVKTSFNVTI